MTGPINVALELIEQIKTGSRLALAKAITLLESDRREDQIVIDELVRHLTKETKKLSTIVAPFLIKMIDKIN